MPASHRPSRKAYVLIALFTLLLVLFPFLFWYETWFGRHLTDGQIDQYFADRASPRHAQHALVQLGERLSRRRNVSRWYPQVLAASQSPILELRQTAAWIMGQDPNYGPFHDALRQLIHDPQPMVRRNAALALSAFGDADARPELDAMLRPYTVTAPAAGVLRYRLKAGDYVNPGTLIAHIGDAEVRTPIPGVVRALDQSDGASVRPGAPLADLAADKNHIWEALRALYVVGESPDLEKVERYTHPLPGLSEAIARQASLTAQAIRSRQNVR